LLELNTLRRRLLSIEGWGRERVQRERKGGGRKGVDKGGGERRWIEGIRGEEMRFRTGWVGIGRSKGREAVLRFQEGNVTGRVVGGVGEQER
jgi:hypothetical protein